MDEKNKKLIERLNNELEFILLHAPVEKIDADRIITISLTLDKLGADNCNWGYTESEFLNALKSQSIYAAKVVNNKNVFGHQYKVLGTILLISIILLSAIFNEPFVAIAISTDYVGFEQTGDGEYHFHFDPPLAEKDISEEDFKANANEISLDELLRFNFSNLYLPESIITEDIRILLYTDFETDGYIISIHIKVNNNWIDMYIQNKLNFKKRYTFGVGIRDNIYYLPQKNIYFTTFNKSSSEYFIESNSIEDLKNLLNSLTLQENNFSSTEYTFEELQQQVNLNGIYVTDFLYTHIDDCIFNVSYSDGLPNMIGVTYTGEDINYGITLSKNNVEVSLSGDEVFPEHNIPYDKLHFLVNEYGTIIMFYIENNFFYILHSNLPIDEFIEDVESMILLQ